MRHVDASGMNARERAARKVYRTGYRLDDGPGRYRIGLLALASDLVVERDFTNLRPDGDEVMVFTNRIPFEQDCTIESLRTVAPQLAGAASQIIPGSRLDVLVYACTSGTAVLGVDRVTALLRSARPDSACVTPITAAWAAFEALGIRRIAVLTPYAGDVAGTLVDALADGGLVPVATTNLDIEKPADISAVTPESIHAGALAADSPEAEGLFISCTDFRALDVVTRIERDLGKPVVTSNQAMFRMALRSAGRTAPLAGPGRLFDLRAV